MRNYDGSDKYSVINGYLVEYVGECTCSGGGPYGHEPGCGYEPIATVEDLLAKYPASEEERVAMLAGISVEELRAVGGMPANKIGESE